MQSSRLKGGQQRWHTQLQCSQWFMQSSEQSGPQGSHQPSMSGTGPWGHRWCRGQAGDAVSARVSVYQSLTKMLHGKAAKLQLLCRCFFRDCTCANWSVPSIRGTDPGAGHPWAQGQGTHYLPKGRKCRLLRCTEDQAACGPLWSMHSCAGARNQHTLAVCGHKALAQLHSQAQRGSCWNALATPRAALHGLQPGLQNADSWCSCPICALLQGLTLTHRLHERCSAPSVALRALMEQLKCAAVMHLIRICEFEHLNTAIHTCEALWACQCEANKSPAATPLQPSCCRCRNAAHSTYLCSRRFFGAPTQTTTSTGQKCWIA